MSAGVVNWGADQVVLSDSVSVLVGAEQGKYPSGNSLLIRGAAETVLVDPSITVVERGGAPAPVDAVINSHGHEDHIAGNALFDRARVHIPEGDIGALRSLDDLLDVYQLTGEAREAFGQQLIEEFHYAPRPDAQGFGPDHVFDLGGGVRVETMHLPGHTAGHAGLVIDDVFFLSDIDLSGFGPYYGDVWSSLDQFEASLARAREVEARWYVTYHHKGIIDGRETFLELIDAFAAVIERRHRAMLDFLAEPRTPAEMVANRFVYRPHVESPFADQVEHRTAELHLERMLTRGEAQLVEDGRYQAM